MCSIIGLGERLHKVLGQVDLGTLDSGERSLPFGLLVLPFFFSRFSNWEFLVRNWGKKNFLALGMGRISAPKLSRKGPLAVLFYTSNIYAEGYIVFAFPSITFMGCMSKFYVKVSHVGISLPPASESIHI